MFGSAPLGAVPLASLLLDGGVPEPIPAAGVSSIHWVPRLIVSGEDWTSRLVGEATVDREEGAAAVCNFALCLPVGPVLPLDWKGRTVALDYIGTMDGETKEQRLFTGRIVDPTWSRTDRILSCICSDQLQQRVESMSLEAIDSLIGGYWSADVFDSATGRSRWEYAKERLSSRTASLDGDAEGNLRVTSWYAAVSPHFVFGPGTTVHDSLDVQLSDISTETNVVEIESEYRFPRLRQRNQTYAWQHPDTDGESGIGGFCNWRVFSSEVPSIDMFHGAVESSGQVVIDEQYFLLPPSGIYCDPPIGWRNDYTDLALSGTVVGARRWAQQVTEVYQLRVHVETSELAHGPIIERAGTSLEYENERSANWGQGNFSGGETGHSDERDEPRRIAMLETNLHQAVASLVQAHRGTRLSWDVPTSWVYGLDLLHTVKLDDQGARAQGKVCRLQYRLDLASGVAMTTTTIAVMRGGGSVSDPLIVPPYSTEEPEEGGGGGGSGLATQLGSGSSGVLYDDDLDGFSGNYTIDPGDFPRRFQVTADEIAASKRDEQRVEIPASYRVAIPNDLLELY